ncbi:carboxylating nicotinate-nucleotide diphosphorylase [Candidatus Poribacteria bacterium]|nr:carboxylating nicotinate-nucleotide diphosphorylase [Candidatus Poribacteria bacterium]
MDINTGAVKDIIELALREDIGSGDITSESVIPEGTKAIARIISKSEGIVAGIDLANEVLRKIGPSSEFKKIVLDGDRITEKQELAIINGYARSLLTAERTMLNFLQRLSGIATQAEKYVQAVSVFKAKVIDTRKTTPGWRVLEKYAVRVGGAGNHRFGLYDAVLIKDNHIAAVGGSIKKAVENARRRIPHTMKIEVETKTLEQIKEALEAGADIIMPDNMGPQMITRAVEIIDGKALVEASGGITIDNIEKIAATGVDYISIGALTHSAMPLDISMDMELVNG